MILNFLSLLLIVHFATPVYIRSGQNFNQNNGESQESNIYDHNGQNVLSNVHESEGYNKDGKKHSVNAQDASRYGESSGVKTNNLNQNQFDQNKQQQDSGHSQHEIKKNVGHNKGHHKSGFHNSYHKDESGSNSSYYDDEGNEGSQYVYDGRRKKYDDSGSEQQKGQNYDNRRYDQDQAKNGVYDNRGLVHNDRGDRGYYNQKQHYDDRERYSKNLANNRYNEGGVSDHNRYYNRPRYTDAYDPYYNDRYPRYTEHSRIETPLGHNVRIYEDPRYLNRVGGNNYYNRDHIGYDRRHIRPYNRYDDRFDPRAPRFDYY